MKARYKTNGFTLLELMVTMMIVSIVAMFGAPAFTDLLKQNKLTTQANSVLSAVNYARNQTINENNDVTIQPIVASSNWSDGWSVVSTSDTRFFEAIKDATLTLTHPDGDTTIVYQPDGSVDVDTAGVITLTLTPDDCTTGEDDIRVVTISLPGAASISRNTCT